MARPLPTGISKIYDRGAWTQYRVFVWINTPSPQHPKGRNVSKRFPKETPIAAMKAWREDQRAEARRRPRPKTLVGFAADCARYLIAVAAMPSFTDRARQIREWLAVFGDCLTTSITPAQIRAARDRWLTVGPKLVQTTNAAGQRVWGARAQPLSASTVNGRLRALENLFTVLYGRRADNPVREVPEADPPDDAPRAIPRDVVAAILAALPDRGRPIRGGGIPEDSLTKARLTVMAYTGLSHSQLARVQPADVDLELGTLYLRPRHKGRATKAGKGHTVPLLPEAIAAFRHFAALECWGKFSRHSMRKSFRRACASLGLPDTLRVYDIRHGFGSQLYAAGGDLHATGVFLGHRDPRTTERYTMAAVDPRLKQVMEHLRKAGEKPGEILDVVPGVRGRTLQTDNRKPPQKPQ